MGERIPEEIVQEVLLRADIADVVGEHVLLRKTGENYKGLCPFHDEEDPFFHSQPRQRFLLLFRLSGQGKRCWVFDAAVVGVVSGGHSNAGLTLWDPHSKDRR